MPKFSFVAKDLNGKNIEDFIEAPDRQLATENLQNQGYFIISIKQLSEEEMIKRLADSVIRRKFQRKGIKLQDMLTFARQLATMLEAGVTLMRSLDVIHQQIESEKLYNVVGEAKQDVEKGTSLSAALAKHPKVFNQFWVSLVEVGEASGTIPTVLYKLTFYLEQQQGFRTTIISAIIYPAILCVVALGAIAFFALFVGPRFESIFKSMNAQLPFITIAMLTTFNFLRQKMLFIVIGIALMIFGLKGYLKTPIGKENFEKFLFTLPTIGNLYRLILIERFAGQMAILVDAGVPILAALDIAERLVDSITAGRVVRAIKEGVRQGELLVAPMQRTGFFPPMCVQLLSVGEETGELSKMLKHVSKYYQETVEVFIKRASTMIEPIMIVFMGAVIGTIVVAMFLPMFNIAQLGGGG